MTLRIIVKVCFFCFALFFAAFVLFHFFAGGVGGFEFQSPKISHAKNPDKDVVGNLGGISVRIPKYYVEYVEYNSGSLFGDFSGKKEVAQRKFESELRSFGMDLWFPASHLSSEERQLNRKEGYGIYAGVISGEYYPGPGSLRKRARVVLQPDRFPGDYWWNNYKRLPDKRYGLVAYIVSGKDPRTGEPARESDVTTDVYIHNRADGEIDSVIECRRTSVPEGIASCDLLFSLEPLASVQISVDFPRDCLSDWREIKGFVEQLLLSFRVE